VTAGGTGRGSGSTAIEASMAAAGLLAARRASTATTSGLVDPIRSAVRGPGR
jgi:hypothetical protein